MIVFLSQIRLKIEFLPLTALLPSTDGGVVSLVDDEKDRKEDQEGALSLSHFLKHSTGSK